MPDAIQILFGNTYNGKMLFRKQSDLVQELLNTSGSLYFVHLNDKEKYERELIRLKTLISQLLSPTVGRNIPHEFSESLKVVIDKKIENPQLSEEIVREVIKDLKLRNEINKHDGKQTPIVERLKADFKIASYIAIITGNPLEIESDIFKERFSMRKLFIEDFLSDLTTDLLVLKKYRLLLPLEPSCILFWKGLKEILCKHIKKNRHDLPFIKKLYSRFEISPINQPELFTTELPTDNDINELSIRLLTFLNTESFLVVFWHSSPLFNLPLIAINPADFKESKIYALLDMDKETPYIHKYSSSETVFWRFFVWDRIKTKQYSGKKIDFVSSIQDMGDY